MNEPWLDIVEIKTDQCGRGTLLAGGRMWNVQVQGAGVGVSCSPGEEECEIEVQLRGVEVPVTSEELLIYLGWIPPGAGEGR